MCYCKLYKAIIMLVKGTVVNVKKQTVSTNSNRKNPAVLANRIHFNSVVITHYKKVHTETIFLRIYFCISYVRACMCFINKSKSAPMHLSKH